MSTQNEKVYEPMVHMFTIFFYVLMSLGLKEILAGEVFEPESQRWPCFIAAFFLLLRFLFGSAVHLEVEPPRENENEERKFLIWHLFCLVVFALFGIRICFSTDVEQFLDWNAGFGAAALGLVIIGHSRFEWDEISKGMRNAWNTWTLRWVMINSAHCIVSYAILKWYQAAAGKGLILGYSSPLLVLILSFFGLLLFDVLFQIHKLYEAAHKKTEAQQAIP